MTDDKAEIKRLRAALQIAQNALFIIRQFGTPDGDGDGEPGFANADGAATVARDAMRDMTKALKRPVLCVDCGKPATVRAKDRRTARCQGCEDLMIERFGDA